MDNIEKIVKKTYYLLKVFKDSNLRSNEKWPTGWWTTSEKQFSSMYSRQFEFEFEFIQQQLFMRLYPVLKASKGEDIRGIKTLLILFLFAL